MKQEELSSKLYKKTVGLLERLNVLTQKEKQVMRETADVIINQLYSDTPSKVAVPLPTGFGKSTMTWALVSLLVQNKLDPDLKDKQLLMCVSSNREIHEAVGQLKEMNISEISIGVRVSEGYHHEYRERGTSEWLLTGDPRDKKVIFMCHARVYNARDYKFISQLCEGHDGAKRLVLWDESAQTAAGVYINSDNLYGQISAFLKGCRDKNGKLKKDKVIKSLWEVKQKIKKDFIGEWELPDLTELLTNHMGKELKDLVNNSGYPISFQKGDTGMIIRTIVKIPDELNCCIFDASANVSGISKLDKSIIKKEFSEINRRYDNCTIHCANIKSGKTHLANYDNLGVQLNLLEDFMNEHGAKPEDVLVITHKQKNRVRGSSNGLNIPKALEERFEGVNVMTWGQQRGINKYQKLKYVVNIGMLWREPNDLISQAVAVSCNNSAPVNRKDANSIQYDEFKADLQQFWARTTMRVFEDGQAKPTEILLIHSSASVLARDMESEIFPGIGVSLAKVPVMTAKQKIELIAERVVKYLKDCPMDKVSIKQVKGDLGLKELHWKQWANVLDIVRSVLIFNADGCWRLDGRSMVRS